MNVRATGSIIADDVVPSPQATASVCVSRLPVSEKLPETGTVSFSSTAGVAETLSITGATFDTTVCTWAVATPPSSSPRARSIV